MVNIIYKKIIGQIIINVIKITFNKEKLTFKIFSDSIDAESHIVKEKIRTSMKFATRIL